MHFVCFNTKKEPSCFLLGKTAPRGNTRSTWLVERGLPNLSLAASSGGLFPFVCMFVVNVQVGTHYMHSCVTLAGQRLYESVISRRRNQIQTSINTDEKQGRSERLSSIASVRCLSKR